MTELSIIPFGGVRENGKNMYAVTVHDHIFLLDAGLKYPDTDQLGVDVVIPDYDYLVKNRDMIAGVFLTHGHADAIGGLPYLLQQIDVPIFGSELTIELAKLAIQEQPALQDYADYHVVNASSEIDFGDVVISFFNTSHSIPDSLGIVVGTQAGQIVYTGDFKFDQTVASYYQTDIARLVAIAEKPVLAALVDSTGALKPTASASEYTINNHILATFREQADKRIIVAAVAANVQRIQQIIDATVAVKRQLVLSGNDIESVVRTALRLKKLHLPIPEAQLFVNIKRAKNLDPKKTVILETGRMGEPIKHLNRMANGEDPYVTISDGDFVFITTTPATAMESVVAKTRDQLFKKGAQVQALSDHLVSSSHASPDDLQLFLSLLKPQYVLPVQSDYRCMNAARRVAMTVGVTDDHILLAKAGDQYQWQKDQFVLEGSFTVDETLIDGSGIGNVGNVVLRDRKILSEDGVFVSVVTIDRKKRQVVSAPKLTSRGFVYVKANRDLMKDTSDLTVETIEDYLTTTKDFDWNDLKKQVRDALSRYLYEQTRRRPMVMPIVMEVNQNRRPSNSKNRGAKQSKGEQGAKRPKAKPKTAKN